MSKTNGVFNRIIRTVFLGFELFVSLVAIEFTRPLYFRSKPIGLKELIMGPLILSRFIRVVKHFINFTTTREQQEELVYWFFCMTKLIERGFGDTNNLVVLTIENFSDVMTLKNDDHNDALIRELQDIIRHIKKLSSNNQHYSIFESNIIKTWLTHKVRDVGQTSGKTISFDDALGAAESRGGFYFLALVYLLNPMGLDEDLEHLVLLSGAWFQIIDDYDDRIKDVNKRNTPFTITSSGSHKGIRKKYMTIYQKQIQAIMRSQAYLIIAFFYGLAGLVTIKPIILGGKSDWH